MKVETVKNKIVKKFGSVNKFCNLAGLNYANLNNVFRQKESAYKQQKLKELMKSLEDTNVELTDAEITPKLLEQIRVGIVTRYKTYKAFCDKHNISNTWLSALLNGKHILVSAKVKELCAILKIKVK